MRRSAKQLPFEAAEAFVKEYRAAAERPDAALGHWVGMATHDDGPHTGPLKPGMVFVVHEVPLPVVATW